MYTMFFIYINIIEKALTNLIAPRIWCTNQTTVVGFWPYSLLDYLNILWILNACRSDFLIRNTSGDPNEVTCITAWGGQWRYVCIHVKNYDNFSLLGNKLIYVFVCMTILIHKLNLAHCFKSLFTSEVDGKHLILLMFTFYFIHILF